jgi:hypothetical protein
MELVAIKGNPSLFDGEFWNNPAKNTSRNCPSAAPGRRHLRGLWCPALLVAMNLGALVTHCSAG